MEKVTINDKYEIESAVVLSASFIPLLESSIIDYCFTFDRNFIRGIEDKILNTNKAIKFQDCDFIEGFVLKESDLDIIFSNCTFKGIYFSELDIDVKIRFHECDFKESTSYTHGHTIFNNINFKNTTFNQLVSFWHSTFHCEVSFYQTNFNGNVTFSGTTFKKNVLFPHTSFKRKVIFSGAIFERGLDLSLSLNSGEYIFFNIYLKRFESNYNPSRNEYDNDVYNGVIPIVNKRETFRIVKQYFLNIGDDLHAVEFSKYEKETIKEIVKSEKYPFYSLVFPKEKKFVELIMSEKTANHFFKITNKNFRLYFEQFSLWLNKWSNDYRNSYLRGLIFTIIVGLLFFTLSVLSLPNYCFEWNPFKWSMPEFGRYYMTFMNPTHDVDLFNELTPNGWTYFWQTWGRIFIGYGIYQTVQAFRKLK